MSSVSIYFFIYVGFKKIFSFDLSNIPLSTNMNSHISFVIVLTKIPLAYDYIVTGNRFWSCDMQAILLFGIIFFLFCKTILLFATILLLFFPVHFHPILLFATTQLFGTDEYDPYMLCFLSTVH